MHIQRIDIDRSPPHPEYTTTCDVYIDGGVEGRWLRYTEHREGQFVTQIVEEDGVFDDMTDDFDCPFDEWVLESLSVLSSELHNGRAEYWVVKTLSDA